MCCDCVYVCVRVCVYKVICMVISVITTVIFFSVLFLFPRLLSYKNQLEDEIAGDT